MKGFRHYIKEWCVFTIIIIAIFVGSRYVYFRMDLTGDKRYTLSQTTKNILSKVKTPLIIDVLFEGEIPVEYQKLHREVRQLLEQYKAENPNVIFKFSNPLEGGKDTNKVLEEMSYYGLTPLQITTKKEGETQMSYLFPWAIANMGKKSEKIPLFKNKIGSTDQEKVILSVQNLEYSISDAINKLLIEKKKKIAVLRSNGTLSDAEIADFLMLEGQYYRIAPFTLDSVKTNAQKTLEELKEFDLLIAPSPKNAFTDEQKQVLDQYLMNGGHFLWILDGVRGDLEDIYKNNGVMVAMPQDLNLGDMFFKYGFRVNYDLINDLYFTQIVIAQGSGNETEYTPIPWVYNPMIMSGNNHIINKNLDAMRMQFASGIDTLQNGIKKSVLLRSSKLSKLEGAPREITLNVSPTKLDKESYKSGLFPVAVLLEGKFSSVYKNRVKPIEIKGNMDEGKESKMIVISDGDFVKNDLNEGIPMELGYDKWTNNFYDNKLFLQNCVNYLMDDVSFLELRNKKVSISFLNKETIKNEGKYWRTFSIVFPLLLIGMIGVFANILYRRAFKKGK